MCSGKSTVAGEFARLGCAVIDADEIAHQLLDEESTKERVVGLFGKGILNEDGKVSREKLGKIVFEDADKLSALTDVLHPEVLAKSEGLIARYKSEPEVKAIVLDMPLLVEVGWEKKCDFLIFIDCKSSERLKRAQKTGFFDAEALKKRENLQISLDKKKRIVDNIVDNNSDLTNLSRQIASIFSSIMDKR